jgi:hypothetical protein
MEVTQMEQPEMESPMSAQPNPRTVILSQAGERPCATCGGSGTAPEQSGAADYSYVYALGRIEARIPTQGLEKEFAQTTGRAETAGLTDRQALRNVLSERQNRYLARQLCWVLTIEGLETYILHPRDSADLDLLIEAMRPTPNLDDVDVVIGVRGPLAPATMCNGLMVPIVVFDQIYSFDRDTLVKSIPKPEKMKADQFESAAAELFSRIMQLTDNAGATDEHRALNYLAVRYPAIYAQTTDSFAQNFALSAVETRPSRLSGTRKIIDVIFSYTNRHTYVTVKYFVLFDVTE